MPMFGASVPAAAPHTGHSGEEPSFDATLKQPSGSPSEQTRPSAPRAIACQDSFEHAHGE